MLTGESQAEKLNIHFRTQTKEKNAEGFSYWKTVETEKTIQTEETAIIVCDMWEEKGCRAHVERIAVMAPLINDLITNARARGMHIILAPSDITDYYKDTPARKRIQAVPFFPIPKDLSHINPPLPVQTNGYNCDSESNFGNVERQHPAIRIDQEKDVLSSDKQEIWNYLQQEKIKHVLILGVHTNMCILDRPFAIQQMVKWGVDIALVRDATDASYNPFLRPYVNHEEGTELVVEYIEKFWCPSVSVEEISDIKPIPFAPWKIKQPTNGQTHERIARSVGAIYKKPDEKLRFEGTTQMKALDAKKLYIWETLQVPAVFLANKTALIIQDMWDQTGPEDDMKRMDSLAPRLNAFAQSIRKKGVIVIHAPGGAIQPYEGMPARKRIKSVRKSHLPSSVFFDGQYKYREWLTQSPYNINSKDSNVENPPLPIHASTSWQDSYKSDRRPRKQHSTILIDQENDCISDNQQEIWNLFHQNKIENVLFAGFLTGENILNNPVGVKQMVSWGINTVVLKDLTVTDCDPDQPPYVNYEEGKGILDGYLEKFWCLTALGEDIIKTFEKHM